MHILSLTEPMAETVVLSALWASFTNEQVTFYRQDIWRSLSKIDWAIKRMLWREDGQDGD